MAYSDKVLDHYNNPAMGLWIKMRIMLVQGL